MTDADVLQELVDRTAIQKLLVRYFRSVDRGDYPTAIDCFTDDAVSTYMDDDVARGREQITAFFTDREQAHGRKLRAGMSPTSKIVTHFVGQMTIEIDGDAAETETYVISHLVDAGATENRLTMRGTRYLDRVERRPEGWRIAARFQTLDWTHATTAMYAKAMGDRVGDRPEV